MTKKLEVSLPAVNNGLDYGILCDKSPIYAYENGKKVNEIPIGTKVDVVLPGNHFQPLTVKIEGNPNALPEISSEEIGAACEELKLLAVRFIDCKIALYSINGQMVMSASATAVELVNFKK